MQLRTLARKTFQPYQQQIQNDFHEFSQRFYQAVRELQSSARTLPKLSPQPQPDEILQLLQNPFYNYTIADILNIQESNEETEELVPHIQHWLDNLPQHRVPTIIEDLAETVEHDRQTLAYANRFTAECLFRLLAKAAGPLPTPQPD